ncbi:unnamed protein product [Allacma fusca]|uniref:BPTI/Kunitz inhibitor domain-containing protein n=1 Tax=Allacma fusca TaxID=39272 RepID=A0A8J2PRY9_9HEXA|nr:unnamed protein product [Allacma fusca]
MGKVLILLLVVGLVHVSCSFPTEPSLEEEVTESPTTVSSGNYSDAVVVEAAADDEAETTSETDSDEAKEFDPNDCFLEKSRGPCRAVIDSWFFNVATKTCEPFMWSGCGGNNNRFGDKIQCEMHCIKGTPFSSGNDTVMTLNASTTTTSTTAPTPTETATPTPTSTAAPAPADTTTTTTSTTVAPSSSTSTTTSTTEVAPPASTTVPAPSSTTGAAPPKAKKISCPKFEGCSAKCIVVQEQSNGGCKTCQCPPATESETSSVKITRSTSKAETSVKSPSVGSVSGLPVSSTDDDSSEGATEKPEDVCNLPPTRGHCRAMMTRYRYDPKIKNCIEFHFGGCDGNSNNFVTKEKCVEFCKGQ